MMNPSRDATTIPSRATPLDGGPFSPRFALLVAMLYNPLILIGYAIYVYGPTTCVAGPLCRFDTFPGVLQVLLVVAGCTALWLLLYAIVERALDVPSQRQTRYQRLLASMSAYHALRPLLATYGAALALGLLIALYTHHASAPAAVVAAFTAAVCAYAALSGRSRATLQMFRTPPGPPLPPTGQVASWPVLADVSDMSGQTGTLTVPPIPPQTEAQP